MNLQTMTKGSMLKGFSMPTIYRLSTKLLMVMLVIAMSAGITGCNNQKKIAARERAAKIEQAKVRLQALLDDKSTLTLDQKYTELNTIKGWNLNDKDVDNLIAKVEDKLAKDREILRKRAEDEVRLREAEERRRLEESMRNAGNNDPRFIKINEAFNSIATATSVDAANKLIIETLNLFNTPDAPVLIAISQNGTAKDYDRPTTIKRYLEYLKDQKRNVNQISNLVFDASGKITELELTKK
ncbi:MAG: hypothetical protein HXX14_06055 [Bacteroidetes bacterium]|nr:hypothetical protein [Bacteroidota bacterium]